MGEWNGSPRGLGRALVGPLGRRVAALARMRRDRGIGPVEQPWDDEDYVAAGALPLNRLLPRWEQCRNLVDFLLPFEAMLPGAHAVAVSPNCLRIRALYPGTGTTVQFDIDQWDGRGLDTGLAHPQRVRLAVSSLDEVVARAVLCRSGPWCFHRDFPSLVLGLRAVPQLVVHGGGVDSVQHLEWCPVRPPVVSHAESPSPHHGWLHPPRSLPPVPHLADRLPRRPPGHRPETIPGAAGGTVPLWRLSPGKWVVEWPLAGMVPGTYRMAWGLSPGSVPGAAGTGPPGARFSGRTRNPRIHPGTPPGNSPWNQVYPGPFSHFLGGLAQKWCCWGPCPVWAYSRTRGAPGARGPVLVGWA